MPHRGSVRPLALVGDFGGTNVRLALVELGGESTEIRNVRHYLAKEFSRARDTIASYLSCTPEKPSVAVIAAAGPVGGGTVRFTNLGWSLSEQELKDLGLSNVRIVNDFVANAYATRLLRRDDVHQIGSAAPHMGRNIAVMGPGTGFGASALVVEASEGLSALAAESGHASFAPDDETEIEILRVLIGRLGHVSIERILSGPGLRNLHEALNAIEGVVDATPSAEDITSAALRGEQRCLRTVERFCAILGGVAGNLALTYGALGGVYITGGIAPDILPILEQSQFRHRFESKGRFVDYLRSIATLVIIRSDAALLGAAQIAMLLQADHPA